MQFNIIIANHPPKINKIKEYILLFLANDHQIHLPYKNHFISSRLYFVILLSLPHLNHPLPQPLRILHRLICTSALMLNTAHHKIGAVNHTPVAYLYRRFKMRPGGAQACAGSSAENIADLYLVSAFHSLPNFFTLSWLLRISRPRHNSQETPPRCHDTRLAYTAEQAPKRCCLCRISLCIALLPKTPADQIRRHAR